MRNLSKLFIVILALLQLQCSNKEEQVRKEKSENFKSAYPHDTQLVESRKNLTNSIQTLPIEYVIKSNDTDASGLYPKSRLISSISPHVIRQQDPNGPRYQEGLSYTFLINSVKFPGLTKMDSGRLVLTLSGDLKSEFENEADRREELLLFSDDDGITWTQPRRIPIYRSVPINLGGQKLMIRGNAGPAHAYSISTDGGMTWGNVEQIPPAPDGRECRTDLVLHPLVEGNTITTIFFSSEADRHNQYGKRIEHGERPVLGQAMLRRFHIRENFWDDPVYLPLEWRIGEGTLVRAKDSSLVAVFRTDMPPYVPAPSDHWDGIATTRSIDNGKSWSEPTHHFNYGYMHTHLLALSDGRILMTYAARIGELDGMNYHGIEAVVSSDNGITWDWEHRFILFRWTDQCTHSPQSVMLSDRRILTVFLHGKNFTWSDQAERNRNTNLLYLGNVSVVIWKIDSH
jgi:hypothetical protein